MRKKRTIRLAAALLLLFLGFCAQSAQAREQADYTVEYIGRAGDSEALLGTKTYRAPAGDTVNVETPQFEDYEREAGQDLAKMDHTFDAYPWIDGSAHSIFVTYFVERSDGTFRRVGEESVRIEKDPDVYGAEVTVFHPDGLTCEEGWYATGSSPEACETGAKIPVLPEQMQGDGACVFRHVGSFLHVYMKKDLFTLRYMDIDEEGNDVVLQTRQMRYKDTVSLDYVPEEGHGQDRFGGRERPATRSLRRPSEKRSPAVRPGSGRTESC